MKLFIFFSSLLYKDRTIEIAKRSKNKLKQNFMGNERSFRIRKEKKRR